MITSLFAFFLMTPTWIAEEEELIFQVKSGEGALDIANNLQEEGVINWSPIFLAYVFFKGESVNLRAGYYDLNHDMSVMRIAEKIFTGDVYFENITIVEGRTVKDIADLLEKKGVAQRQEVFAITGISAPQAAFLEMEARPSKDFDEFKILKGKPRDASLEGYLFPDTYRFSFDTPEEFIKRMISTLENNFQEEFYERAQEKGRGVHEIIIMASILEKEVPDTEERKKVSDVLWRRLDAGMPLQVDATVNYITGRRNINVTLRETRIASPYNTYQNKGLPQGPICNPGMESIKAALYPAENDYWFYLSEQENGKTIFSRNYLEHMEAKRKYLR